MNLEQMINRQVIGTEEVTAVNSREVYNYLEVVTKYPDWIKRAIDKYGFVEGEDFQLLKNEKSNSNNPKIDYIVSLDMAKELCMVSNTVKGKETRKYFIKVEKEANKPMSQVEIALMTLQKTIDNEKKQLELEVKTNKVIEEVQDVKASISYAKTKEVLPEIGYASISTLENLFAGKFPKSHIRGILTDTGTKGLIKVGPTATKWVNGTATWTNYKTYSIQDTEIAIDILIKTGIRVIGVNGKPTQKLKSPLYGQEFKGKK